MRTILASLLITAVASFGCGGKSKSEMTDPCKDMPMDGDHHEEMHEGEEHAEPELTPEMARFHDVLAPLWHAEAGPQRVDDTCEASGHMLDLSNDIQKAPTPEGADETAWIEAVQTLMIDITHLQDACPQVPGGVTFDDAFTNVHESFHALMAVLPKE